MKNLFYIHTHDMGKFNSLYGYAIKTPNMESIAKNSTLFRDAHCACPTCSPSRGALLTGMMPHSNGLTGLAHRRSALIRKDAHLSRYLSSFGYHSVLNGIQHETIDKTEDIIRDLGYDEAFIGRKTMDIAGTAADYIRHYSDSSPLFMSIGFYVTHRPFLKHDATDVNPDYIQVPPCLPDNKEVREDFADYITSCENLDVQIGRVLEAIRERGMYDDAVILLTTDHGIAFPFMKCSLYDTGTGVTLAIKPPAGNKAVPLSDALVSQIDVFPTLCDLLELPKPDWLQGKSLVPLMEGKADKVHDFIFTELTFHAAYEPVRAVRAKRYKYVRHFDDVYTNTIMPNMDDGGAKRFLAGNGMKNREIQREELYDLVFDPQERNNLANATEYDETREYLSGLLKKWMTETDDPLLVGKAESGDILLNKRSANEPSDADLSEVIK